MKKVLVLIGICLIAASYAGAAQAVGNPKPCPIREY